VAEAVEHLPSKHKALSSNQKLNKIKTFKNAGRVAQVTECLAGKYKVPSSNLSTAKKKSTLCFHSHCGG
jgi:hypothetical protein